MGWRDYEKPTLVEKTEKIPIDIEKTPLIPLIPPKWESKNPDSIILENLTEGEREAYQCLVEIAQTTRFGSDPETAEEIAGSIVTKKYSPFQLGQAVQDYKKYGFIKIYSGFLGKAVYFAKDERAAKRVPNNGLPVFLESDTKAIKDLAPEEIKLLLEAKILFGGPITVEDYSEPPSKRKADGKQIARNFFGK